MKITARYSWATDKFARNVTYDPPKQREYQELCSIQPYVLNNIILGILFASVGHKLHFLQICLLPKNTLL